MVHFELKGPCFSANTSRICTKLGGLKNLLLV